MAPPSVWTTPGVRGLEADVDDTVVVLLGPAVVVLVVVLVGEDVLELLDEDELDEDELDDDELLDVVDVVLVATAPTAVWWHVSGLCSAWGEATQDSPRIRSSVNPVVAWPA